MGTFAVGARTINFTADDGTVSHIDPSIVEKFGKSPETGGTWKVLVDISPGRRVQPEYEQTGMTSAAADTLLTQISTLFGVAG